MRPASNDVHIEMNDTKGVKLGSLRGYLDSSNDTRLFLVIAQQTLWVLKYILGMTSDCTSIRMNENEVRMNEWNKLCVY